MEQTYRPQLSRETRLLLTTAALALAVLWVLARLRFPDSPAAPNPVAPILTQLSSRPAFDDLSAAVAEVHDKLSAQLALFDGAVAFRLGNGRALAWLPQPSAAQRGDSSPLAVEPWSGLAVVRTASGGAPPAAWNPANPTRPRYLMASDSTGAQLAVRPVYIGRMDQIASIVSDERAWLIPSSTDVAPGTFLFTADGQLVGLTLREDGRLVVIPGSGLAALADRVVKNASVAPADLGIHVQALTGRVADAVGADSGVIVTSVDPALGSSAPLGPGDVIQGIDGHPLPTMEHWIARMARVRSGTVVTLRVRRGASLHDVPMIAPAPRDVPAVSLGLAMRRRPSGGTEIMGVDRGAAGDRAGLRTGDVVTRLGDTVLPRPADIRGAFVNARAGQPLLVAVTRGATHWITTLEK
jgi:hypothetical protein